MNVMTDDVQQNLNKQLKVYNNLSMSINSQDDVRSLNKIKINYKLLKKNKIYKNLFLMIKSDMFDVFLNKRFILNHKFYKFASLLTSQLKKINSDQKLY